MYTRNDHRSEQAIERILKLLEELESWIDDIPPQASPQRYGNLAFRDWGRRLEEVRNSTTLRPTA
jgi:serine/threonine-protein phosphatase 2A activator